MNVVHHHPECPGEKIRESIRTESGTKFHITKEQIEDAVKLAEVDPEKEKDHLPIHEWSRSYGAWQILEAFGVKKLKDGGWVVEE
jgi:hypothetical protein